MPACRLMRLLRRQRPSLAEKVIAGCVTGLRYPTGKGSHPRCHWRRPEPQLGISRATAPCALPEWRYWRAQYSVDCCEAAALSAVSKPGAMEAPVPASTW